MDNKNNKYQNLMDYMSCNLTEYIKLDVGYSLESNPMLIDILNQSDILNAIVSKAVKITERTFIQYIPNFQVGLSFVDNRYPGATFYKFLDNNECTYFMMVNNKICMFFEIINLG